jgi:uncharacterized protein (TIGR00369 family)
MNLETMSGLEILQAIIRGEFSHPTIASTVPMQFLEAEAGRVLLQATASEDHMNPMGGTHGGFAATVLDTVTGCAIHSMLEAGVAFATIELNIKMLRPVPLDTALLAEGKLINLSRSLGVSEGTLKDNAGKLYAHATSTCMIIRK